MYLKKIDGPRAVNLPDGSIMTRADLPPVETRRWVASRKAAVVKAVRFGLLSEKQALDRYGLSSEELSEWMRGGLPRRRGAQGDAGAALSRARSRKF